MASQQIVFMTKIPTKNPQLSYWLLGIIVLFMPWAVIFFLRVLGPITFQPLDAEFLFFLLLNLTASFVMYSVGYFPLTSRKITNAAHITDDSRTLKRMFHILYITTIMFGVLAFYDYFFIKGASLSEIVATREKEHITGPRNSLIGAVVALLSGAPPLLTALLMTTREVYGQRKLILYSAVLLGFAAMFLSGGRNPFFIGLLFIFSLYFFFLRAPSLKRNMKKRPLWFWGAGAAIFIGIIYSMYLFIERSIYVGVDLDSMLDTLSTNYDLSVYSLSFDSEFLHAAYVVAVFLTFYVTHALNYISDYFAASYSPMLDGAYTIPHLARLIDILIDTDSFNESRSALLVNGAYLSSPGSFYVDFGYFGAIAISGALSFVFGSLIAQLSRLSMLQKLTFSYLVVAFIFYPIYCVFGMANGFSIIFLLILMSLSSMKWLNPFFRSVKCRKTKTMFLKESDISEQPTA